LIEQLNEFKKLPDSKKGDKDGSIIFKIFNETSTLKESTKVF
jgi:hypothetical protein